MTFHGDFDPRKPPKDIRSNSLWIIEGRGEGGGSADYHGNFIPEIPRQLLRRYTSPGDVVLDCFAGSGTTIDVAKSLGRQVIASDIYPHRSDIVKADAKTLSLDGEVDFIILHPPYWKIVEYTFLAEDLSNASSLEDFLGKFEEVVSNVGQYLPPGRFLSLVMADVYLNKELVLLSFESSRVIRGLGYRLKSVVVKNVGSTQGKGFGQGSAIWRYRALKNNFTTFDHEYILTFEKL